MTVTPTKIDSNLTGLAAAIEASIGVLPASPVWQQLEPNSYKNWGGQITLTARNPIVPTRQQRKGSITDNKIDGGYVTDLKPDNLDFLMPGLFFAAPRQKFTTLPFNLPPVLISSIAADVVTLASVPPGAPPVAGSLVLLGGFTTANNGLNRVTTVAGAGADLTLASAVNDAAPAAGANLVVVGVQGAAGDIAVVVNGNVVELTSTVLDFTTLGLIAGEWMYIGGDTSITAFATAADNGYVRIASIAAHTIVLDKTSGISVSDAGTGKTIQLFFGTITKNETSVGLINRYTYQFERTLGNDGSGVAAEYLIGSVASELELTLKAATLASADVTVMAIGNISQPGSVGPKSQSGGSNTVVSPTGAAAYNTVSDFSRVRLYSYSGANAAMSDPVPLVAYIMDTTITVKNNLSADNALGVLGPFELTAGNFEISASITAYFASVSAVQAIQANADVTLDMALSKQNQGILIDIPLLALGEGRLNVVKDKPIELPLSIMGAQHPTLGWTASWTRFYYLPSVIAP